MGRGWDSFFVAQVGASAALTGLVFVAISINLSAIMEAPLLVGRAGEAVILLVLPALMGLAALVPDLSLRTTGIVIAVVSFAGFLLVNRLILSAREDARLRPAFEHRTRIALAELALVPALIGAATLIAGSDAGFYWLAFAVAAELVIGIFDGWVLLIEILR